MWEAEEPYQRRDGWWGNSVREHTMHFPCHSVRVQGVAWEEGRHRNAATALGCAEREARSRNRGGWQVTDVLVRDEGTILLIRPVTAAAREWVAENVNTDGMRIGDGFAADHRCGWDILEGMHDAGLELEAVA